MAATYRLRTAAVVALCLLCGLAVLAYTAAAATSDLLSVAGRVEVRRDVAQYVVMRVVDDKTGVVVRSAPLDATRAFSFANIAASAVSVEATVDLPDHLFQLDTAASVLKSAVSTTSSTAAVQLTIATTSKAEAAGAKSPAAAAGSSIASAVFALIALLAAWSGRHRIVGMLDMPTLKPPKPRRVMMGM